MMYGKTTKMSSPKETKKDTKKGMPLAIMIAVGKPKMRPMPERGGRTATNMMKKSSRGK
ncbi:hypothetical protein CCP3SC1AL1_190013 [Gammaproteobacteria bacterium]